MQHLLDIPVFFGVSIEVYFILLIIAVPTFFISRWVLKKFIKIDKIRRIFTWVTTIILTPIIYIGLISLFIFWMAYTPSKDFDKSQWFADRESRFEMADDIIKTEMLIGKDTNQVKQILGDPNLCGDTTLIWTYDMGTGGGVIGFMDHTLQIQFKNNKVEWVKHAKIRD